MSYRHLRDHRCQSDYYYTQKNFQSPNVENTRYYNNKTIFKQHLSSNPALQKTLEGKLQHKEDNENKTQEIINFIPAKPKEETHTQTHYYDQHQNNRN